MDEYFRKGYGQTEIVRDKLIDGLFRGRKSINLVFDGLSTWKKYINPGFGVKSRDAIASKKLVILSPKGHAIIYADYVLMII